MSDAQTRISELIGAHPVVLFMKGSRRFPQCGFSSRVISILDRHLPKYETVNVLQDPEIRDGVKAFSQWPTIPQLYVRGKFVGGCDIITEMAESGELKSLLGQLATAAPAPAAGANGPTATAAAKTTAAPSVTISEAAAKAFASAAEPNEHPRLVVSPSFEVELYLDSQNSDDVVVKSGNVTLLLDAGSASRANGVKIDFVIGASGEGGFKIDNPNEPPRVRNLTVKDLKGMLERNEVQLFDVRPAGERTLAAIPGDRFLDEAGMAHLDSLPKDTAIAVYCHHGPRSRQAAGRLVQKGFTRVYNVDGGVDAYARQVDPKVPTY